MVSLIRGQKARHTVKVITMVNDYRELALRAKSGDLFQAYQNYTAKFPALFEGVFKYLYLTYLAALRPMIENVNFDALLKTAEDNISSGYANQIITQSQALEDKLASLKNSTFIWT